MKAQARKILALIMAMVMCLSLAAPAFAFNQGDVTAEAAGIDTTGAATATDIVDAVATKDVATKIEPDGNKGGYKVMGVKKGNEYDVVYDGTNWVLATGTDVAIITGNVTNSTQPDGVSVSKTKSATYLIGSQPTGAEYRVSYGGKSATVSVAAESGAGTKTIDDVTEWKTLSNAQATFTGKDTKTYQVEGSYYEETLPTGNVNVFFKLSTYENGAFNSAASKIITLAVKDIAAIGNDNTKLANALRDAAVCNSYGEISDATKTTETTNAVRPTTASAADKVTHAFTTMNGVDLKTLTPSGTWIAGGTSDAIKCEIKDDKSTGTFEIRVQNQTGKEANWYYLSSATEVETLVKNALDGQPVIVESVVASSGNYFTVTVKKNEAAKMDSSKYKKNVMQINGTDTAVLIDTSKDGWFNGTKTGSDASTIAANTEATGPVAVRVADLSTALKTVATDSNLESVKKKADKLYKNGKVVAPVAGVTAWADIDTIVFKSLKDAKGAFVVDSCKEGASVPYAELKMNAIIGSKENALVNVSGDYKAAVSKETNALITVEPIPLWFATAFDTPNADFVNKGKIDVAAGSHVNLVEVVEETPATCQTPGTKTTKKVCSDCNQVISEKTETVPVVSDPLAKNDASDYTKWAFETAPSYKHYVAKQEDKTETDAATGIVTKTTYYTCNFGHVHTEMNHVETAKKAKLQHSGRWDNFTMDKVTEVQYWANNAAGKPGFVNSVTVADTDVELTSFPINDAAAKVFQFDVGKNFVNVAADGNYYDNKNQTVEVYSSATGLPTTKTYAAKLTIKDIKVPATKCLDASCTVLVDVYELAKGVTYASIQDDFKSNDADKLAKLLSDKKISLVKNHTQSIVVPGQGHNYINAFGEMSEYCTICGEKRDVSEETKKITADTITISNLEWTGKAKMPKIVVKDTDGNMLIKGIDYEAGVEDDTATDVGTYAAVIKGIGDFAGYRISKTYEITKVKGKITASGVSSIQASKKKAVSKTLKIKVTGGKVKSVSCSGIKGAKVTKAGKITIPAKAKAGTLKVKIKMKADKNHTAAGTKTVKIKVKAAK